MYDLKKCEMYPMISGFQESRSWYEDKMVFTIHGNPGSEIWFRRLVELSETGRIWELNEEGKHLRVTRNEEDYHLLARRFSRHKKNQNRIIR